MPHYLIVVLFSAVIQIKVHFFEIIYEQYSVNTLLISAILIMQ